MTALLAAFLLLVIYQIKHWCCDFPLQTPYMLGKFKPKGWMEPLAAHAMVHALFTDVIAGIFLALTRPSMGCLGILATAAGCGLFDFCVHFAMDRVKASPDLLGRYKALSGKEYGVATRLARPIPLSAENRLSSEEFWDRVEAKQQIRGNRLFWLSLGFDQMTHHLTHYAIIAFLVTR